MDDTFRWDEAYSVGVDELDSDHKRLLSLGNAVIDASTKGQEQEALSELLVALEEESSGHFVREEALMQQTDYPLLADHHAKHDRLTAELQLFIRQYEVGHIDSKKLAKFLIDWLVHHIVEEDRKFQKHYSQLGKAGAATNDAPAPGPGPQQN